MQKSKVDFALIEHNHCSSLIWFSDPPPPPPLFLAETELEKEIDAKNASIRALEAERDRVKVGFSVLVHTFSSFDYSRASARTCLVSVCVCVCVCMCVLLFGCLVQSDESKSLASLQEDMAEIERLLSKQSLLQQQRDECQRKIRDLGALPTEAHQEEYEL
jgi:hypothetical protein